MLPTYTLLPEGLRLHEITPDRSPRLIRGFIPDPDYLRYSDVNWFPR
ncbi:MAG: hypothetical protein JO170_03830 [Verrucomicrobia bacterium]|nr:hypothetical protein [Verrucomicrobiota bacterium]